MSEFLNALTSGLGVGSVYAFVALAFSFIYRATGSFNFAQGQLVTFGSLFAYTLFTWAKLPAPVALILTVTIVAVLGGMIERVAVWPLARAQNHELLMLISTLGIGVLLTGGAERIWGTTPLATLFAYSSLALVITNTVPISDVPPKLFDLALYWHGIPRQTLLVYVPVIAIVWLLMRFTVFGRHLYGLGTNAVAERFAAGPVVLARFSAFAISGMLAGIVALVTSARFASARPDAGLNLELQSITIAVLGGVAITGGVGTVPPVVLATLLITLVNNGINLAGIDPIWQQAALGGILIGSALLNSFAGRRYGAT